MSKCIVALVLMVIVLSVIVVLKKGNSSSEGNGVYIDETTFNEQQHYGTSMTYLVLSGTVSVRGVSLNE